ncbi:MAG: hypothetical protein RL751_1250, partial [Bacteroidota bacterium]
YLHKVDSKHMLGMYSRIGRRAPLHCTAIGKVLLAWENPERRERIMLGSLSTQQNEALLIPSFVKPFNGVPYVEIGVGIENILKVIRIDLLYRATHQIPGTSPFAIKARYSLNF